MFIGRVIACMIWTINKHGHMARFCQVAALFTSPTHSATESQGTIDVLSPVLTAPPGLGGSTVGKPGYGIARSRLLSIDMLFCLPAFRKDWAADVK
jgi:hypothetical protein